MMITAYAPGGLIKVGPPPIQGVGAPASTLPGKLGQEYFDTSTSPPTGYIFNGATWVQQIVTSSSGTTITGNLTVNGNIIYASAGNKDVYTSVASTATAGANSAGTVTLVGGTATITTTAVTASSFFRISRQGVGSTGAAALGILTIGTVTAGTSFVINAVQAASAIALQGTDVSVVAWEIVN